VNKPLNPRWVAVLDLPAPSEETLSTATETERSAHGSARPNNVVSEGKLGWSEQLHGEKFGHRRKQLGSAAGGQRLGCSLYEVPPGRTAFPRHYHLANEEAIYVLEGSGTLRIGQEGEEVEVSQGDYVALPGGADETHQLVNTSSTALRYLCFSTMVEPDVMVYPDSGKVGIVGGAAPGGPKEERTFAKFLREDAEVGYYDGED
jgi:uncharacterized cupin superfamily protein